MGRFVPALSAVQFRTAPRQSQCRCSTVHSTSFWRFNTDQRFTVFTFDAAIKERSALIAIRWIQKRRVWADLHESISLRVKIYSLSRTSDVVSLRCCRKLLSASLSISLDLGWCIRCCIDDRPDVPLLVPLLLAPCPSSSSSVKRLLTGGGGGRDAPRDGVRCSSAVSSSLSKLSDRTPVFRARLISFRAPCGGVVAEHWETRQISNNTSSIVDSRNNIFGRRSLADIDRRKHAVRKTKTNKRCAIPDESFP